jgi:hypothetical protein
MKYLLAAPGTYESNPAVPAGEPVIPALPVDGQLCNHFIGVKVEGQATYAVVKEHDLDPDAAVDLLTGQFPGMPKRMLEDMLFLVLQSCASLPADGSYRVFVQPGEAKLQSTLDDEMITLWEGVDNTKYL